MQHLRLNAHRRSFLAGSPNLSCLTHRRIPLKDLPRKVALLATKEEIKKLNKESDIELESCLNYAGEYCALDPKTGKPVKRTLGDMEADYLLALNSWYNDSKPIMTDAEFEVLKEELTWAGSKVVVLDGDEQRFLNAAQAFFNGKPVLTDDEFDELKAKLKGKSSVVTAQGPRCSIRSKKMYGDAEPDYARMLALNVPGILLVLGFLFAIDDITGFEISEALELPPPFDLIAYFVVVPAVVAIAYTLTNFLFKDYLVLKAPCPSCGQTNFTYFGSIITVAGNRGQNSVECGNCKALLTFDELKRVVVVDETAEDRASKLAAAAAKKEAAAKKKAARVQPPPS